MRSYGPGRAGTCELNHGGQIKVVWPGPAPPPSPPHVETALGALQILIQDVVSPLGKIELQVRYKR